MSAEGATSYQGVIAQQNAKVHAGHVYSNVTNNYPSQPAITSTRDASLSTPIASPRIELAPAKDPVHKEFLRAARDGQGATRLEYLLSRGANVDAEDCNGCTALYYAAFRGDDENVRFLVDRGADVNHVNSEHHILGTPIAVAALRRHAAVVETLLQRRADVLRSIPSLGSALHCACFGGDPRILKSILYFARNLDYLASNRVIYLKAFSKVSELSATGLSPFRLVEMMNLEPHDSKIRCSPIFLAAEQCHFDILHLCRSEFHHDYLLLDVWSFSDREYTAAHSGWLQRRSQASWTSVESRSGASFGSKASTSSAWSLLGFPLAPRDHSRLTLLMWAAASLNLPLISHLLEVGAPVDTKDDTGKTALHYAATPFLHATFKDVKECVQLLLASKASLPTKPSIPSGQRLTLVASAISPLELVVSSEHAALDPRTPFKWGPDIHHKCISSFLDPLSTKDNTSEGARMAELALLHALSHGMCSTESILLLCKHAVWSGCDSDPLSRNPAMDKALCTALRHSAAEPIILILLDHGANPNAERNTYLTLPLMIAVLEQASDAVVTELLQHGANPNLRTEFGLQSTPYECARRRGQQDLIALFSRHDKFLGQPETTPSHSADSTAAVPPRWSSAQNMPTGLNNVDEVDEMDELDELSDIDEELMYDWAAHFEDRPGNRVDSNRPWYQGIPGLSLPQF